MSRTYVHLGAMSIPLAPWGWVRSADARRSTAAGPHPLAGVVSTGVPGVRAAAADPHPDRAGLSRPARPPAGALVQVAARHHVTTRTVANSVAAVRGAGGRIPLPAPPIAEAPRVSAPGDDHLGRVRICATLGLPTPALARVDHPTTVNALPAGHRTVARAVVRLLTAVGPLDP